MRFPPFPNPKDLLEDRDRRGWILLGQLRFAQPLQWKGHALVGGPVLQFKYACRALKVESPHPVRHAGRDHGRVLRGVGLVVPA